MQLGALFATMVMFAGAGVGLAPNASAETEPAPPLPAGMYAGTILSASKASFHPYLEIRHDCGPGCYTLDDLSDEQAGGQYRYNAVSNRWENGPKNYDAPCAGGAQAGREIYHTTDGIHIGLDVNFTRDVCGQTAAQANAIAAAEQWSEIVAPA
jgi:hypothetical protein